MARLLIVTDTTFYRRGGEVLDNFCFDRRFFDDYCAEFEEVRVAARVSDWPPAGPLHRADGDGLAFVDLLPARGLSAGRWHPGALLPRARGGRSQPRMRSACGCPASPAGMRRGSRRREKPMMFELIGDPLGTALGSPQARIYGLLQHRRTRWILRRCAARLLRQRRPSAAALSGRRGGHDRGDLQHPARARLAAPTADRALARGPPAADPRRLVPAGQEPGAAGRGDAAGARRGPAPRLKLVGDGETRARSSGWCRSTGSATG